MCVCVRVERRKKKRKTYLNDLSTIFSKVLISRSNVESFEFDLISTSR